MTAPPTPTTLPTLFKGQLLHIVFLSVALPALLHFANPSDAAWLGLEVSAWFYLALAIPILHQSYVWLCWRLELRGQRITGKWGLQRGFRIYAVAFFALFSSRFLTLLLLAIADHDSVAMSPTQRGAVAAPILLLGGYAMFSVKKYFGFQRAAGIDHFDPAYANMPFVRKGVFKWTPNAMYVFAIQLTWLFGILAASKLAMFVACFQSIYIWVHYLGTERPDMAHIYR